MIPLVTAAIVAPANDMQYINLAVQIAQRVGDRIWPGWSKTPFPIDLLTARGPVEINFDKPVPAPSFPPQTEATFPWPNGVPTIVIGERQFTQAQTPIRWTVTLLHEHFHQWQDSWPEYDSAVKALGLAPQGDTNAMWMLNYPFPYADPEIQRAYARLSGKLADAVEAIRKPEFVQKATLYTAERDAFRAKLNAKDYKYFAFVCWQEGVARYTEMAAAAAAVAEHRDDPKFLTITQTVAFYQDASNTYRRVLKELRDPDGLKNDRRAAFYAFGAAEAMLLDYASAGWHDRYLSTEMDLETFFPPVILNQRT
jgi:hypothetical protein